MHLISKSEATILITEIASALTPGGRLIIYGPFKRNDELTGTSNKTFHQSLIQADPQIVYKSDARMVAEFNDADLKLLKPAQMPANNLAFIREKPQSQDKLRL